MIVKKALYTFFTLCVFNILGAQNRESSYPYILGDSFRAASDFVFDELGSFDPADVLKSSIIFVKTDNVDEFFKTMHPRIAVPYVLVSHNSDYGSPRDFTDFLSNSKLIHWFGQNPTVRNHPKFTAIPLVLLTDVGHMAILKRLLHAESKRML